MNSDTIAQRKARAIERLTNDRDAAINRAEAAEARAAQLEAYIENNIDHALIEHDDYARLEAERDAALGVVRDGKRAYQEMQAEITDLKAQRDAYHGKLDWVEDDRNDLRRQLEQAQQNADQRLEMLYSMRGFLYGWGYTEQAIEAYLNALDKEIEAQS